ncbi:MAG: hypothetical protein EOO29_48750 [Comamonadaceae bacterium]|nr:MAG: hypothetical protein EOO29_48750 [Comamonadaceae bacterium]
MDNKHHPPPSPTDGDEAAAWHALVDDRLPPAQAAALRDKLERQAGAEETVAHWQNQRQQLRALHQHLLTEPVPEALLAAAQRASVRQQRQTQWWRWGGMAASVLMAFTLGWTGRSLWPGMGRPDAPPFVLTSTGQRFAQQAAVAHAVYQPEVRHAVEVPAAQQEHLVQWLSKRLSRPLKLPVLADDLRMERDMVRHCFYLRPGQSETVEGIRALAVDKDHAPKWNPARIEDVTPDMVAPFFASPWPAHAHPLVALG